MVNQVNIQKAFLSRKEAAEALGVSLSSIVRGINAHQIPCAHIGGRVLIPAEFVANLATKALEASETK